MIFSFSGGQDSLTAYLLTRQYLPARQPAIFLSVDYGQRHVRELTAARRLAYLYGVEGQVINAAGMLLSASPIVDHSRELEQYESPEAMAATIGNRIELTFVPLRNLFFAVLAANVAVARQEHPGIVLGVCQDDNANYPDCREEFITDLQRVLRSALGGPVIPVVLTPLLHLPKHRALEKLWQEHPRADFARLAWTHTAYDGAYPPIGKDHATVLRAEAFAKAGLPDPLMIRALLEHHDVPIPDRGRNCSLREWEELVDLIAVDRDTLRAAPPDLELRQDDLARGLERP